jgi:lycopene beta-cyclase
VTDADIVVVGAGAAGLSLVRRLVDAPPGRTVPSVVLVEPPPGSAVRSADRTWCFWEQAPGEYDDLVTASWDRLLVRGRDGRATTATSPLPYRMIRSTDFVPAIGTRLASAPQVSRMSGTVTDVRDAPGGGLVTGTRADGGRFGLTGRWVFDSRPPGRLPPARTTLLQHFRGWFVTTEEDRFDPSVAELMDFRTRQPARGLSFSYVLPFGPRHALVEYTEFSAAILDRQAYDAELWHYTRHVRPLGAFTVTGTEQGVIPMTDGVFPRRTGRSVFRLGAAGGATRPSTGYTFAAIQRQTAAVAAACHAGRTPVPPRPHTRRHHAMDAAMLRALATGRLDGAAFFEDLFRRNPLDRVLRFLDGRSTLREEWAIGVRSPVLPMARSLAELPFLPRRADRSAPVGQPPRNPEPTPEART